MKKIILLFFMMELPLILLAEAPIYLPRLKAPIQLDGVVEAAEWNQVESLPLIMFQPTYKGNLTEETEIRIAYDANFLYASGRFYDSEPEKISSHSLYRDAWNNDDTFEIIIDAFNDNENGLWFWTNPAGMRGELALSGDATDYNGEWNTYWSVRTTRNRQGWFFEMRIPFSSLGFRHQSETVTIGITAFRLIARKNEKQIFPAIAKDKNPDRPSQTQEVILRNINIQRPVYLTPYILGGFDKQAQLLSNQYQYSKQNLKEIGLDVKYNITNNLTLDVTTNTDFAQAEADDEQINLTRFSLYFPEKRQFFQERAGIFSFNTGAQSATHLFYSRQIGLYESNQVRILGGARLIGRIGDWDIGFINMQTEKFDALPSENFGVLRLRKQVLNEYSYAGSMFTSRLGANGNYNYVYGLDANLNLIADEFLSFKWAHSFDKENDRHWAHFRDAASFKVAYQRRCRKGLNYLLAVSRAGSDYTPDIGFVTRQDFTEYYWDAGYTRLSPEKSQFQQVTPFQLTGFVAMRNHDSSVESGQAAYKTNFYWKSGATFRTSLDLNYEDLPAPLKLPENTFVPAGDYYFPGFSAGFEMPWRFKLRVAPSISLGQFYDGRRANFASDASWNISEHLELRAYYSLDHVRFPDRNQEFNSHIIRLKVNYAYDTHFSIRSFVQYNGPEQALIPNVRIRYNVNEGHDLWIVYNEGINTDRHRVTPVLLRTENRTVLVKYTYTYRL